MRDFDTIFARCGKPDNANRNMLRGLFDGRYKLIRYFSIDTYHQPETVEALLTNNDVALYDLVNDPHEIAAIPNIEILDTDLRGYTRIFPLFPRTNSLIRVHQCLSVSKFGIADEMVNLARPEHPDYDERLLAAMNEKLNRLIVAEIGDDSSPYGY